MLTTVTVDYGGWSFEVEAEVVPYRAAVTSGPPENCCPQEGGEVEICSISTVIEKKKGNRVVNVMTTLDPLFFEFLMQNKEFVDIVEEEFVDIVKEEIESR